MSEAKAGWLLGASRASTQLQSTVGASAEPEGATMDLNRRQSNVGLVAMNFRSQPNTSCVISINRSVSTNDAGNVRIKSGPIIDEGKFVHDRKPPTTGGAQNNA